MARTSKMWFRADRGAWFTTIDGDRHNLGPDKAAATKAFHLLMAGGGRAAPVPRGRLTVAEAAEAMLASVQHMRPSTRRLYDCNLGPFAARHAARKLDTIRPEEVRDFVAAYPGRGHQGKGYGDSSRYLMFRFLKQLFKWAKEIGLLELNPLHGATCPWRIMPRERVMTRQEYDAFMASKASPHLKELVAFLWATGARPGEAATICARHLVAARPMVILQPSEHKTGTKTGMQRKINVPAEIMDRLRAYAIERPRTPLFVRKDGRPWSQRLISDQWYYWKNQIGLPADCVLYLARHAFGTRAIEAGCSIAQTATMLGHRDTKTLMTHYFHADEQAMLDAVEALNAPASATSPDA